MFATGVARVYGVGGNQFIVSIRGTGQRHGHPSHELTGEPRAPIEVYPPARAPQPLYSCRARTDPGWNGPSLFRLPRRPGPGRMAHRRGTLPLSRDRRVRPRHRDAPLVLAARRAAADSRRRGAASRAAASSAPARPVYRGRGSRCARLVSNPPVHPLRGVARRCSTWATTSWRSAVRAARGGSVSWRSPTRNRNCCCVRSTGFVPIDVKSLLATLVLAASVWAHGGSARAPAPTGGGTPSAGGFPMPGGTSTPSGGAAARRSRSRRTRARTRGAPGGRTTGSGSSRGACGRTGQRHGAQQRRRAAREAAARGARADPARCAVGQESPRALRRGGRARQVRGRKTQPRVVAADRRADRVVVRRARSVDLRDGAAWARGEPRADGRHRRGQAAPGDRAQPRADVARARRLRGFACAPRLVSRLPPVERTVRAAPVAGDVRGGPASVRRAPLRLSRSQARRRGQAP